MSFPAAILFLATIYLVLYGIVTRIVLRNVRLRRGYRLLFSLTAMPVFTAAMIFNIWLSQCCLPWLFAWLELEPEPSAGTAWTLLLYAQGDELEAIAAFLISTPVALALTFGWYLIVRALERATRAEQIAWPPGDDVA